MNPNELASIAKKLVAPGRGILAIDESFPTITKRFKKLGVESTEDNRRAYRETLLTTPGLGEFISGAILFDETLRQKTGDGKPFPGIMAEQGIIPGIKVDKGAQAMALFPGEKVTEGLDGLRDRFAGYRELGAKFSKWRAVLKIGDGLPTDRCLEANAHALARFAALSQEAGLVPVIEPEVLMDGDHGIERAEEATTRTLQMVFDVIARHRVALEGVLLKTSMVLSGKDCPRQAPVEEVAAATLRCLRRVVPPAVPGVVFLSGGQSAVAATQHLNAMNGMGGVPWELSFSYGRALQEPALNAWAGDPANVRAAQRSLRHRARCNSLARFGRYSEAVEAERERQEAVAIG